MTSAQDGLRVPEFDVADRLRKARETAEYDQVKLAELMGVSRETVSNYERGRTKPRKIVLNAWALATGVPVTWLRDGVAPVTPPPGGDISDATDRYRRSARSVVQFVRSKAA